MKKRKTPKKRERKIEEELFEELWERVAEVEHYVDMASPFEISKDLALLGVRSTYRDRIYQLLDMTQKKETRFNPKRHTELLYDQWYFELQERGHEIDIEDKAFLIHAARRFVLEWAAKKIDQFEAQGLRYSVENLVKPKSASQ